MSVLAVAAADLDHPLSEFSFAYFLQTFFGTELSEQSRCNRHIFFGVLTTTRFIFGLPQFECFLNQSFNQIRTVTCSFFHNDKYYNPERSGFYELFFY